ncbi:hypothetical protein BS47DRAFT_1147923 [Hydnum rufescens UP504]|uniref:Peptidase A1 domain-containing protein n=1 Tax=Hydnum rufescens UP504 TaxID=1448309 RepID=A0A9P6ATL3_9AGAM|nr:hypothetical protein BS47DRAFT_1147923 [Hydnum rufescens UP504]
MRAVATILSFALLVAALPSSSKGGLSIPLRTRSWEKLSNEQRIAWIKAQDRILKSKYGKGSHSKRASSSSVPLTDQLGDVAYYATVNIGTPPQPFNTILDTGSSDLWVIYNQCIIGCDDFPTRYDPTKSSTFKNSSLAFTVPYGGGTVSGTQGAETVTMANFTVNNQAFGVVDTLTPGVIFGPQVSGLMGLAWTQLATTGSSPWWSTLTSQNAFSQPLFAFNLARLDNDPNAGTTGPGGTVDLGFLDSNIYTGSITYYNLISETYWLITLNAIVVNGKSTSVSGPAAIDSGTTFIAGPTAAVAQVYSTFSQAQLGTGDLAGHYVYPCASAPTVSLTFGTETYAINLVDFSRPIDTTGQTCFGAISPIDSAGQTAEWIVGDTFMKSYYTVFRSNPSSVGFAQLKNSSGGGGSTASGIPTFSNVLPTDTFLPPLVSSVLKKVTSTLGGVLPTSTSTSRSSGAPLSSTSTFGILGMLASVACSIIIGVLLV